MINQRLKTYQDEILIRDKSIRDLSVDNANLSFKYRHQSIEHKANKLENDAHLKNLERKYQKAAKDYAEMCNQQSKQIDKIDKLHFSEKTSSELLDFDKNLKNGKTSGAPMLLSLLSNNHKLNQRNNFLE